MHRKSYRVLHFLGGEIGYFLLGVGVHRYEDKQGSLLALQEGVKFVEMQDDLTLEVLGGTLV